MLSLILIFGIVGCSINSVNNSDVEKPYAIVSKKVLNGYVYFSDGVKVIDDFYVSSECGVRVNDTEVNNAQR